MNKPNSADLKSLILNIIPQLSKSMLSLELTPSDSAPDAGGGVEQVALTLEFSGDLTGTLALQPTAEFAQSMTAARLGPEAENEPGNEEIQNVLTEFATAAADQIKAVMAEAGVSCNYSPSGAEEPTRVQENLERLAFQHGEQILVVEMDLDIPGAQNQAHSPEEESHKTGNQTAEQNNLKPAQDFDLDLIYDIPIELTVEIGRTKIPVHELLKLGPGSAVSLSKLENEPVDILANDTLIARGQVVVQDEKYGIRVTEITSRIDRIKSLT